MADFISHDGGCLRTPARCDTERAPDLGSPSGSYYIVGGLTRRGQRAVAVTLRSGPGQGLGRYRELIVEAGRGFGGPVAIVAQSPGGFSAPLTCDILTVERLVLVNAMIPMAGETAGAWCTNVGWQAEVPAAAADDGRPEPDVNDAEAPFPRPATGDRRRHAVGTGGGHWGAGGLFGTVTVVELAGRGDVGAWPVGKTASRSPCSSGCLGLGWGWTPTSFPRPPAGSEPARCLGRYPRRAGAPPT